MNFCYTVLVVLCEILTMVAHVVLYIVGIAGFAVIFYMVIYHYDEMFRVM